MHILNIDLSIFLIYAYATQKEKKSESGSESESKSGRLVPVPAGVWFTALQKPIAPRSREGKEEPEPYKIPAYDPKCNWSFDVPWNCNSHNMRKHELVALGMDFTNPSCNEEKVGKYFALCRFDMSD